MRRMTYLIASSKFGGDGNLNKPNIQGVPKKIGINDLVWYIMIWLLPIVLYGLDPNPGNSHKSSSDPGLVRVRPNTRTLLCLRCCQTRTSWCHFTLPFHLGWGGWYWRATTFSRELKGEQGIYQRGRSRIGFIVFYRLVDALLTYESWLKVVAHQYHPLRPSWKGSIIV